MSTPTLDFLEGIAAVLVTAGAGVYNADGSGYTAGQTGIALNDMPDDPDRMIVLTAYSAGADDLLLTESRLAVQVRTRGTPDPRVEMAIRDDCYAALQGLRQIQLGSVWLIALTNISSILLGRDSQSRWENAQNFYADVNLPTTNLRS